MTQNAEEFVNRVIAVNREHGAEVSLSDQQYREIVQRATEAYAGLLQDESSE
jgi:hypothetical protein